MEQPGQWGDFSVGERIKIHSLVGDSLLIPGKPTTWHNRTATIKSFIHSKNTDNGYWNGEYRPLVELIWIKGMEDSKAICFDLRQIRKINQEGGKR